MKNLISIIKRVMISGSLIFGIFLSKSCINPNAKMDKPQAIDTSRIHPQAIEGLWEEVKHHHDPGFIFIQKDSIFLLKGEISDYKINNDTISTPNNKAFMWKVLRITKNEMVLLDRLRDTIWLKRK